MPISLLGMMRSIAFVALFGVQSIFFANITLGQEVQASLESLSLAQTATPHEPIEEGISSNTEPKDALMVLRFNRPNVYYKPHLKTAVMRALAVKNNVQFILHNKVPKTGNSSRDAQHENIARHNADKVYEYIVALGVQQQQILVNKVYDPQLLYDEIYIYVR